MNKKDWFAALKHPVPADMEYYLEEKASQGLMLCPVGEKGFFYFEFIEDEPQKCKYMVDISKLPKSLYMETMIDNGWSYLGKSGNCYIWRQSYEDVRPKDLSDKVCKQNHCRNLGLIMLFLAILCTVAAGALIWGFIYEIQMEAVKRHYTYIVEAVLQVPLFLYFWWAAHRLLTEKK